MTPPRPRREGHPVNRIPLLALTAAAFAAPARADEPEKGWIPLFNGKNLDGWAPKITGHDYKDNFGDTFRVEDGLLKVRYDKYKNFDGKFGHLFYKDKFSSYKFRVEYRFVGDQVAGGPGWAIRNSGVMIHCQSPESMRKDQEFPVSVEVQLLGGDGKKKRPTANVCSPGTHIVMGGKLITQHCNDSKSDTYHGDKWVTVEVEVHGDKAVKHVIDGKTVMEYEQIQYDPGDADAKKLLKEAGGEKLIKEGYISLQSESHPIDFRKVEILPLDK